MKIGTVDELSGGRLTLGIGVGWIEREFDYLGADFVARGDRTDEYIAALRELWTAEEPRFAGDAVRFEEAIFSSRPRRRNGIPIVVGGSGTRALRRAARFANGWHALDASPKGSLTPQPRSPRSRQTDLSRSLCASGSHMDSSR